MQPIITADHFSGCLFGDWLANNTLNCPNNFDQMDGGGELGKSCEMTVPNSSHQNGPGERLH